MKNNIASGFTINGFEITIKSGNLGCLSIFLVVWLSGWTYGGYEAWKAFISLVTGAGKEPISILVILFLLVWLSGWFAGEVIVTYILLWGFFGREIITVHQGVMKVKNDIAGIGWTRTFNVNMIKDMMINVVTTNKPFEVKADFRSEKKKFGGIGLINFGYEGKTCRFCMSADKNDAEQVLTELKKALPAKAFEEQ